MTQSSISIDSQSVQSIVSKAIVDSMSSEARERVIQQAVQHLVAAPKKEMYAPQQPSPIQHAFNVAVQKAAVDVVREMVDEGDLKERIREMVREKVVDALTGEGYNPLASAIGGAVGDVVQDALQKAQDRT